MAGQSALQFNRRCPNLQMGRRLARAADVVVIAYAQDVLLLDRSGGSRHLIVITAGLGEGPGSIADEMEKSARRKGLRIIGPNCLGV